jgi:hypothetical protein
VEDYVRARRASHLRIARQGIVLLLIFIGLTACQREATPVVPVNSIIYGQTVTGQLGAVESRWMFVGNRNDLITIEITTSGEMPVVALVHANGDSVARLPASSGRLDRSRLPSTGQYAIVVGAGAGDFSLTLRLLNAGDMTPSPFPTPATTPTGENMLRVGDSRNGSLKTGDAQDLYTFVGKAGEVVTIRMAVVFGEIDPTLRLFGPDGAQVASDENSGGGRSAMIGGIKLPQGGVYFIRASGGGRTGDYLLSLESGVPAPTATPPPSPVPPTEGPSPTPTITPTIVLAAQIGALIHIGQTIQGRITSADQVDRFIVFGPAGAVVSVGMFPAEGSQIVPSFVMYAPNGEQVGLASGAGGGIITGYTLPASGAYIIYARAFRGESSGAYTLTVGDGVALRDVGGGEAVLGTAMQGNLLRSGDREVWTIDLPANATFSVEAISAQGVFDPVIEVVGPDGKVLGTAQATGTARVARLAALTTTVSGRHHIRVRASRVNATGSYALTVRILKVVPTATFVVDIDETIEAEVDEGQRYSYSFKAISGTVILIDVRERVPGGFDPVIEIFGPSGRRLAIMDDIKANSTDAVLQLSLDDGSGAYTVQVYGYAMTPGAFRLRIKAG